MRVSDDSLAVLRSFCESASSARSVRNSVLLSFLIESIGVSLTASYRPLSSDSRRE